MIKPFAPGLENLYKAYFFSLAILDCRKKLPVPTLTSFQFSSDTWRFYLDWQRVTFPRRIVPIPFLSRLKFDEALNPAFPFQGQWFVSFPGRYQGSNVVWRRHEISRLSFKLSFIPLNRFVFFRSFRRLIRSLSQVSVLQQIRWRSLFSSKLIFSRDRKFISHFDAQRRLDLLFHPWIFSSKPLGSYTPHEVKFLNSFLNLPGMFFSSPPYSFLKLPVRFKKRFYNSVWISSSFSWICQPYSLTHRFSLHCSIFKSPFWLKQRPGLP